MKSLAHWILVLTALIGPTTVRADAQADGSSARSAPTAIESGYQSPAHTALAEGDPRRALELLDSRTLELPVAERHYVAGRAHFDLNEFPEARRELTTVVQMRRNDAAALYWLGRALAAGGSPALAIPRFEQAAWQGLDAPELHHHWALAERACGNLLGTVERRAWPKNAGGIAEPGQFALGGVVVSRIAGRAGHVVISPPHSALYHALRALRSEPQRGEYQLLCAEIWAAARKHRSAVASFAAASTGLCGEALQRCYAGWTASLLALGEFDTYLEKTREAMILTGPVDMSRLAEAYDAVAAAAAIRGELRRQIGYLTLAVEMHADPRRRLMLAEALLQANQPADAVVQLEAALQEGPTAAESRTIQQRLQRATFLASPP